MEEYIVSARKYRPATFDTVVGQRALTTTLLNAIRTHKLAHAYLFCGPRGVGKTTCARIFAKTINCLSPRPDGEACNECESCRTFDQQRSMNIHELDAASNNSVDDIRELIEQVRIPPQGGKYKVFIIDEVHMLSSQAFNAFLKTLEEPPSYVIFILATTEKHKILPTILSRCQVYDFARMTIQNTVDHLAYVAQKEGYTAEPQALNLIAQKADGGMRDALSIFDQMVSFTGGNITYQSTLDNLNVLDSEYYFRLVDHFLSAQVEPCLLLFDEVLRKGFDGGNFIAGLASHLRDLLVSRDPQTLPLLEVSEAVRGRYLEQARRCQPQFLCRALKLCNDCDVSYRQSRNKRLQVELCLIQAAQLMQDDSPAPGLRPEDVIKPIFNSAPTSKANAAASSQAAQPAPAQKPAPPAPKPKTAVADTASAAKSPLSILTKPATSKPAKLDLNSVCINETAPASADSATDEVREESQFYLSDRGRLTESNMIQCWQQFATLLQPGEVAMANRLRGITPRFLSDTSFLVTVGSHIIAGELQSRKAAIESFFARHIGVPSIEMQIEVMEAETVRRTFSKGEILQRMKERNSALGKLVEGLQLEIE
ncbi:MAG: DNA polymerase III subunit gamma/tau [Prevotellaceae bacterium]|nr:DNA polymerase III subunit gamma/tau [Prevotellaceae bacterium]